MAILQIIFLLLAFAALQPFGNSSSAVRWDYGEYGPTTDAWGKKSPLCCKGKNQSPINLDRKKAQNMGNENLEFQDYDQQIQLFALNNGHSVQFSQDENDECTAEPAVCGGGLDHKYIFHSFHFHWGSNNSIGSEHFLNGKQLAMELHLVHYRSDFQNLGQAVASGQCNALAVIGVFFAVKDNQPSEAMEAISEVLPEIIKPSTTTTLKKPIALEDLLPSSESCKYRYSGSLTTPDCNEVVTWTVYSKEQYITTDQMNNFRRLEGEDCTTMNDNFRPLQDIGNRKLLKYGKKSFCSLY